MATAAFFAPLIVTTPDSGVPEEAISAGDTPFYTFYDGAGNLQLELYLEAMENDIASLEEKGVEVTYPDREEFKAAGSVVIDEYCEKYPEFKEAVDLVRELQGA